MQQQQLAGLVCAKCAGALDPLAMLCARKYQDCFRSYAVEEKCHCWNAPPLKAGRCNA